MAEDDQKGRAEEGPEEVEDLAEELRLARLERDRLRARLLGREALLRAAARRIRRFAPADPVAESIDRELGDGLPD